MYRAAMKLTNATGIGYSEFLSWSNDDQARALDQLMYEQALCGGCGTHPSVWDLARGGHPQALVAVTHTCPGCVAMVRKRREVQSLPELNRDGVHIVLIPNPDL